MATWKLNKAQRRNRRKGDYLSPNLVSPVKVTDVFGNSHLEQPLGRDQVAKIVRKRPRS